MERDLSGLPNNIRLWAEALLSGKYEQGQSALRTQEEDGTDSFCCLGVYLDIVDPEGWLLPTCAEYVRHRKAHSAVPDIAEEAGTQTLSMELWESLTAQMPNPNNRCVDQATLADANDNGVSFEQIVDKFIIPLWSSNRLIAPNDL